MDILNSIHLIQQQVEEKMQTSQAFTYQSIILPAAKNVLNILKSEPIDKWPRHNKISNSVDIYIEALSIYVIYNYTKNIDVTYSPHIMMLVLLKHPYFINVFSIGKNKEEWDNCASDIINEYILSFGKNINMDTKYKLKGLLSKSSIFGNSIKSEDNIKRSGLSRFNYMIGFYYLENEQGILKKDIIDSISPIFKSKNIINYAYIIVNISFNVDNTDSIIIYKECPRFLERILIEDRVGQSNVFIHPKMIHKAREPFTLLDSNFKPIKHINDMEYGVVLLSYNDSDNVDTCHYMIARYGDDGYLNKKEMNDFLAYRVMRFLDSKLLELELIETFYINRNQEREDITELKRQYIQFISYTKRVFEESTKETFIDKFIENIASVPIIRESEIRYLKIYLHGIYLLKMYNSHSVISYVSNYIYPDLLTKEQL